MYSSSRKAFTLIELLVVIAIIAILAVVVVLTLNPAELLRQSRDSNRVSDMNTLNSAINLYNTDQTGAVSFNLGSSSVVYVSIPDPNATTTAGTNCSSLGLATLSSGWSYHCAASSTYKNVNGTGWIPVNLSNISAGTPISSLPVDPVNTSSSRDYYTYTTNGTQFEITAPMESQKYGVGGSNDVISTDGSSLATVLAKGSNLTLEPLDYGDTTLVGYWPLTEGASSTAYDESGNGINGTWSGTQAGTSGYYSAGNNQSYAGAFNGSNDYILAASSSWSTLTNTMTVSMWYYANSFATNNYLISDNDPTGFGFRQYGGNMRIDGAGSYSCEFPGYAISLNTWQFITAVVTPSGAGTSWSIYKNGVLQSTSSCSNMSNASNLYLGIESSGTNDWNGLIEDIRIYNRGLSAAQVAAMYNGGK